MLGPITCPVEKRGSSTVNVSGSRIAASDEVMARHEPAVEARQPRDGLVRAQPREDGVGIAVELLERDDCADREPVHPIILTAAVSGPTAAVRHTRISFRRRR